jgi:hypothetical protein
MKRFEVYEMAFQMIHALRCVHCYDLPGMCAAQNSGDR